MRKACAFALVVLVIVAPAARAAESEAVGKAQDAAGAWLAAGDGDVTSIRAEREAGHTRPKSDGLIQAGGLLNVRPELMQQRWVAE